ncbi:Type 1 glutamine amidotransferase-like domain-containing protein [Actinomadura oligospora]|uniref:Type 1 glutamine amidotransferase-like domain-containing protein n=1 Tax=Actinomadura oligospora TaxID=111804 RepID=UPI00047CC255|nr:Type 1 glutamine amidotransferase-like domain-containing protein [Actinomadura oligospora]
MRLYLSSFRIGDRPDLLLGLCGGQRKVAVIADALDAASEETRRDGVQREIAALAALGLEGGEIDLREFAGRPGDLADELERFPAVWVRGGNVFALRYAMARSGADALLTKLVQDDAIVYAGYSAGACVLAPSLRGLEAYDDPNLHGLLTCDDPSQRGLEGSDVVPETVWDGLGVLDFAFVPHVGSPGHPECEALTRVADGYRANGVPFRALRDGQVLVVDGESSAIVL